MVQVRTRRRVQSAVVAVAATALAAACSTSPSSPGGGATSPSGPSEYGGHIATAAMARATVDPFGIRHLRRTQVDGMVWHSTWTEGDREFEGVDPQDPWFDADHGDASYRVEDGDLYISGEIPRMYVYQPSRRRQWHDVEVTMYFKRVADSAIPYAGMTIVARSNHLETESGRFTCDTRGYGARMRYDGDTDFSKETAFPLNEAVAVKGFWAGDLPRNRWIGVKLLVYDRPDGVHLELWSDLTDGKDGGTWNLINQIVDDGTFFGDAPCAPGIDPRLPLTNAETRPGSETGKPNLTVWFRSDGVLDDGLVYKWGSIREISVL